MTPSQAPVDIDATLAALTLEEKASLLSGLNFWETQPVSRDNVSVPSMWVSDGPHGLRKQADEGDHLGLGNSVPATCFPTAAALGSTWDSDLLEQVGAALGRESKHHGVSVLLGPGANIKRDPRCGRNFEYLSEDPVLSGDLAAALIRGTQSQGVGTSLKHFAANNQEDDRMRVSAEVDERSLREIYLASFERAIAGGDPWTIMCSYNKINGTYASHNHWLLTEVLRQQWGWDGLVVSDWGAVRDRVAAVAAGLDLEMPGTGGRSDADIAAAVRDGSLDESVVDTAVRRVLHLINKTMPATQGRTPVDADAHHALARQAAAAGVVLLRNEPVDGTQLLPLSPTQHIAVIGEFARTPRYQGAGSSQVNPTRLVSALHALSAHYDGTVTFAPGFTIAEGPEPEVTESELRDQAVAAARDADIAVVFLGLPAADESEGYDRTTISLPPVQLELLAAIHAVNPRVVVALANGSVVTVSEWQDHAPAIVEGWLGGQAGAEGLTDILTGASNPSGKLAETIPVRLHDVPAYENFPGGFGTVRYGEGIYVGYRWYERRDIAPAYPFGHGLSYTTFTVKDTSVTVTGTGADTNATVHATITNTGHRAGAHVLQVYVHDQDAPLDRPDKELKAFTKVHLAPGESTTIALALDSRAFAFWHPAVGRWVVGGGQYQIAVGESSQAINATHTVTIDGEDVRLPVTDMSTMGELRKHPIVGGDITPLLDGLDPAFLAMVDDIPSTVFAGFGMSSLDADGLEKLIARANEGL